MILVKNKSVVYFFVASSLFILGILQITTNNMNATFMSIPFNVVDTNTYFAFMNQAGEGHILFTNQYTPEPVPYIIFNPMWLIMGWITILIPPVITYYIFKFGFLVLFFYLLSKLIDKLKQKNIILFFVLFGSGIGYVFVMLSKIGFKLYGSIDQWAASSNTIGTVLAPVHFLISVCLMLTIIILYLKFWEEKKHLILIILLTLLLGFIHLFDVITLGLMFGLYMLWLLYKKKENLKNILKYNLIYALCILPAFIYTYYLYSFNPYFIAWNAQNVLDTPKLLHVIFGYFIPLIFAVIYFFHKKQKLKDIEVLLYSWIISGFILLYSPLNIQRRFLEGLFIPIMILGALGFIHVVLPYSEKMLKRVRIKKGRIITIILVCLLISPTSFYWLYRVYTNVKHDIQVSEYSIPYYLTQDELEALEWLDQNTENEDIVISAYGIGNYIPRMSGNRVFLGHWAQTIDYENKKELVRDFYSGNYDYVLELYDIDYIYYGNEEKKLGNPDFPYEKVFENNLVKIYKI